MLFSVPDGHQKEMPTAGSKHKPQETHETGKKKQEAASAKEVCRKDVHVLGILIKLVSFYK